MRFFHSHEVMHRVEDQHQDGRKPLEPDHAGGMQPDLLFSRFEHLRLRLVDRVLIFAGLLSLLYAPVVVWRIGTVPWHAQLGVNALFVLIGIGLLPFVRRLSLRLNSAVVIAAPLALGFGGIFTMGMSGPGYLWMLGAVVLTVVLYSLRAGIALAVTMVGMLGLAGFGFISGFLAPPLDLNSHLASPSAWIGFLLVVVFTPLSLLYPLANYQAMTAELARELDAQRKQLARLVGHDQLTGLPLSALAMERLGLMLANAHESERRTALLFIDLDGFKAVNDGHGHAAGDHLLMMTALRLRAAVRETDMVARVGGDEFLAILGDIREADASRLAENIMHEIAAPIAWHERELRVGASIGIALFPEHGHDAERLRRAADAAMYQAKKDGKNRYRLASMPAR